MSEQDDSTNDLPGQDRSAVVEAAQAVVDRVTSWQDGAPAETVRAELEKGLSEAQVAVPDGFVDEVVHRIADLDTEHFDVAPLFEDGPA